MDNNMAMVITAPEKENLTVPTMAEVLSIIKQSKTSDLQPYIDNFKEEPVHEVRRINVTIDEQILFILGKIEEAQKINFLNLVNEIKEKIRIIVTFIAILELVKMNKIKIKESPNFNDFVILKGD